MKKVEFFATENNGGGLALAVLVNEELIYIHAGYEYGEPNEQLAEDVKAILAGSDTINDFEPESNYLEEFADAVGGNYDKLFDEYVSPPNEIGANNVIVSGYVALDGDNVIETELKTYPSLAGAAGAKALEHF